MIRSIWNFISDPKTLAVLALLGGAIAFLWKIVEPRFFPASKSPPAVVAAPSGATSQTAVATGPGSSAVNAGQGASVSFGSGNSQDVAAGNGNAATGDQRAEATDGGTAINAGANSRISVSKLPQEDTGR